MVHAAFRFSKGLMTLNMKNHCGVIPVSELQCNRYYFLFLLIYLVALNPHQWYAELTEGWEGRGAEPEYLLGGKTAPPTAYGVKRPVGGVELRWALGVEQN